MNNTFAAVKSACENMGLDVRSYSGRAMYGKSCLGIEVDRYTSAATVAFRLAVQMMADGAEDEAEEVAGMEWSQDSMGLDTIVYLRSLKWEDETEEGDEDAEDDAAE